ncbi:hypothetical protein BVY00_00025 [bacterium G20]|nr:hypothetical protein BVY00_00025 [bacterium G20]
MLQPIEASSHWPVLIDGTEYWKVSKVPASDELVGTVEDEIEGDPRAETSYNLRLEGFGSIPTRFERSF